MSKGKIVAAIAGVVIIGGIAAGVALAGSKAADVEVAPVTREDLSMTVSAAGSVEAEDRLEVYPPTSGTLESIEVTEGARVTAGQVLAVMDTAPIEAQVAQAEAAYRGALAQREAAAKAAPGASDKAAAQAAVDAAKAAFDAADAAYRAALAGAGAPTESDIASARSAVAAAQAQANAATAAYDAFYENVYLPAPQPRDATLEGTLAALALARDQAAANLATAQRSLAALLAASDTTVTSTQAKLAREQAYAAYLGAVAQRDALTKASSASAVSSADAAVDAAAQARRLAQDMLDRATITAPSDGVVIFNSAGASLLGVPGAGGSGPGKPTVGSAVSPAAAPFAIVAFDRLAFVAQVDESDITRIVTDMPCEITLDGLPDDPFGSRVQRIGKESVLTPTGGTAFPVRMAFDTRGATVLLGMNGSVEIAVETVGNVVTMPVEALLEDGGATYAYTVRDGRAHRTEIEIGRLTDTRVEIRSGLAEGDEVIVSGAASLADGARVRVK